MTPLHCELGEAYIIENELDLIIPEKAIVSLMAAPLYIYIRNNETSTSKLMDQKVYMSKKQGLIII